MSDGVLPTSAQVPARVLTLELRVSEQQRAIDRIEAVASRLFWVVLGGSLSVALTVASAALYVGARFEAVAQLDRRVARIEDAR